MNSILSTALILVVLFFLAAIFSLAEMAIVTARKSRLQNMAESGSRSALVAIDLQEHPNRFLSTAQIGISLLTTLVAAWSEPRLEKPMMEWVGPWLGPGGETFTFAVVVGGLTYAELVLCELVPKRLALQAPESISVGMARSMDLLSRMMAPVVALLSVSTNVVLWLMRQNRKEEEHVTADDICQMVHEGAEEGTVQRHEEKLIDSVFRLGDRKVRQVRTPRTEVVGVDLSRSLAQQLPGILESGYSRLPAYREDLDHIEGLLMVKDLLQVQAEDDLTSLLRPALFVHEETPAVKVLRRLQRRKTHLAIVVDEHGTFEGVVSMEDLLEEIVGEIEDEYDKDAPKLVKNGADEWTVAGDMAPDRFREVLGRRDAFPGEEEERYDTIAGFVLDVLGRIPQKGESLRWENLEFTVAAMDGLRIESLRIHRLPEPIEASA